MTIWLLPQGDVGKNNDHIFTLDKATHFGSPRDA